MIISLVAFIIWVLIISYSKLWVGTKIGDVMIIILGFSSAYGLMIASTNFYEWIIK